MHLVCGEALFDIFVEPAGSGDDGTYAMVAVPGGSPLNVAVGLARLGCEVALATDLASDEFGQRLADRIAREGIASSYLRRSASRTALAFVAVDEGGVPSYDLRGLEEACFAPSGERLAGGLEGITNLHLGSIALVLPNSANALLSLARTCSPTMLVSLDPNVRLAIEPDRQRWREAIERLRPFAHLVKVSEEDIEAVYGTDVELDALCESWLSDATELVTLTRGQHGARIFSRGLQPIDVPIVSGPVIDTVGAGDSFLAALLARLDQRGHLSAIGIAEHNRDELEDLGRYAITAAALTCSRRGPTLPSRTEVESLAAAGWTARADRTTRAECVS